jgi:hypothetical protein
MTSLKYSFAILLFIALITQSFSRSLLLADYLVNVETYKKNCINKAKPMLHCNGKCQMLKKIKKQEGENNTNVPVPKFNTLEVVLYSKTYFPSLEMMNVTTKNTYCIFNSRYSSFYSGSIFHPPTV